MKVTLSKKDLADACSEWAIARGLKPDPSKPVWFVFISPQHGYVNIDLSVEFSIELLEPVTK